MNREKLHIILGEFLRHVDIRDYHGVVFCRDRRECVYSIRMCVALMSEFSGAAVDGCRPRSDEDELRLSFNNGNEHLDFRLLSQHTRNVYRGLRWHFVSAVGIDSDLQEFARSCVHITDQRFHRKFLGSVPLEQRPPSDEHAVDPHRYCYAGDAQAAFHTEYQQVPSQQDEARVYRRGESAPVDYVRVPASSARALTQDDFRPIAELSDEDRARQMAESRQAIERILRRVDQAAMTHPTEDNDDVNPPR